MDKTYTRPEPDADRIAKAQELIRAEQDRPGMGKVVAIDPFGCGCTECLVGEYVPLQYASGEQLVAMILGELANNTGYSLGDFQVQDNGDVLLPKQ